MNKETFITNTDDLAAWLDGRGVTSGKERVATLGGALCWELQQLPPNEKRACLIAHIAALICAEKE